MEVPRANEQDLICRRANLHLLLGEKICSQGVYIFSFVNYQALKARAIQAICFSVFGTAVRPVKFVLSFLVSRCGMLPSLTGSTIFSDCFFISWHF